MNVKTLTVSSLNNYIKKVMDNDYILKNSYIKGEISNFKLHTSGHIYFSLKDEYSKINCVMFRSDAISLKFLPEDGMNVIVKGRVSVYLKDGSYQLYCNEIKADGVGELFTAFQQIKDKLESEGLFDISHKKTIPQHIKKIGVVTSPTGAAIRDIINVTKRRNSAVDILIYPALVQGTEASKTIIAGIKKLNQLSDIDVIILARGGGSMEELWAFNDEKLAYEIFNCQKPVITGVGHETDFTIADFVSDLRAPTPSAAAEIAVPSSIENKRKISEKLNILQDIIVDVIEKYRWELENENRRIEMYNPVNTIINEYNNLDKYREMLNTNIHNKLIFQKEKISNLNALLMANNPQNILNKGYSMIEDETGLVISDIKKIRELSNINIILKDGRIYASIKCLEEKLNGKKS